MALPSCSLIWDREAAPAATVPDSNHPCGRLTDQAWDLLRQDPGSCVDASDCTAVGGQLGSPTCGCTSSFLSSPGPAIGRNSSVIDDINALQDEFIRLGCEREAPLICDAAPHWNHYLCTNNRCVGIGEFCYPPLDAGVPDAGVPDAAALDAAAL